MRSYRVYWLDNRRRIVRGDWLQALDDDDARRQAAELCDEDTPTIEVWEAARPVDHIDCHPAD
jgi:hypothetical protein